MAGYTNYLEEKIANYVWRAVDPALPGTLYVALFTDVPLEDGTGTEVAEASYERQPIVRSPTGSSRWAAPAAGTGVTSNLDVITFPEIEEDEGWGLIVARGLMDAAAAGNMLTSAELTTYRETVLGDVLKFPIGALIEEIS